MNMKGRKVKRNLNYPNCGGVNIDHIATIVGESIGRDCWRVHFEGTSIKSIKVIHKSFLYILPENED